MWRHLASNAVTFLALGLFLIGGLVLWGKTQYTASGPLDQAICLQVDRGSNMRRVSATLEQEGAVSSGTIFRISADYADKADKLKAGSYLVPANTSMENIVDIVNRKGVIHTKFRNRTFGAGSITVPKFHFRITVATK